VNPDLLAFLRGSAPRDVTATPSRQPQPTIGAPTGTRVPPKEKGLLAALLRSAEPSEDTPLGMLNEYLNPIRQGAVARELVGDAAQAVGRGDLGRAAGMGAMAAMAVPGVPGNPRAAGVAEDLIDVGGVMRPRLNSLGQPIHPTEEGIRNFWKWFGESKTVDEVGRPQVMYHGTTKDIESFVPSKIGALGPGSYTTSSAQNAAEYGARYGSGQSVYPLYVRSENPFGISDVNRSPEELFNVVDPSGKMKDADVIAELGRRGFDAVSAGDRFHELSVINPVQIKSAIGNTGAFSLSDPRITRSIAALLGAGAAMRQPNRQK